MMLTPISRVTNLCSQACPAAQVVKNLAAINGPVDVYCWYEGEQGLPKAGADFMTRCIFEPLFKQKRDAKLCLYSLKAWEFLSKKRMLPSNPLGEAINKIDRVAVECIYSSAFFQYCAQVSKDSELYRFIQEELPKKTWLKELSAGEKPCGITVNELFKGQTSLFDCIKELDGEALDAKKAYSLIHFVEGYYLIRESVRKGLEKGQKKIEVAFVLPNDEGKYYRDFPMDIERMLKLDFKEQLTGLEININFQFFEYGKIVESRPYIDKSPKAEKVTAATIGQYFNYFKDE